MFYMFAYNCWSYNSRDGWLRWSALEVRPLMGDSILGSQAARLASFERDEINLANGALANYGEGIRDKWNRARTVQTSPAD
jgi:hypothetical protein